VNIEFTLPERRALQLLFLRRNKLIKKTTEEIIKSLSEKDRLITTAVMLMAEEPAAKKTTRLEDIVNLQQGMIKDLFYLINRTAGKMEAIEETAKSANKFALEARSQCRQFEVARNKAIAAAKAKKTAGQTKLGV
jgi:hypothetical protein